MKRIDFEVKWKLVFYEVHKEVRLQFVDPHYFGVGILI